MNAQVASGKKGPLVIQEKKPAKSTGAVASKQHDVGGSKSHWLAFISVLRAGGRDESGGVGAVDFGVSIHRSAKAKMRAAGYEPWEKLPAEIRASISKKEYEQTHVRESEEEEEEFGLLPAVVFSFSKKKCEEIADHCRGLDMLSAREKGEVRALMSQLRLRLNPLDSKLPQVLRVEELLLRGIGVHHGGLLPILKEAVELLFARSVVKVLFATETFAMVLDLYVFFILLNFA